MTRFYEKHGRTDKQTDKQQRFQMKHNSMKKAFELYLIFFLQMISIDFSKKLGSFSKFPDDSG